MRGNMKTRLRGERGSVLVVAILVMMVLSFIGMAMMTLSVTEHSMAYNAVWGEGAFAAAEAGINVGINQLSANATTATKPIPATGTSVTIASGYTYRSGGKSDAGPQPVKFIKTRTEPGYSIALGTGYNPAGYAFNSYQVNATGTGPRNAVREIEIQAEYGPVAQ